jgi:hypothetical protein
VTDALGKPKFPARLHIILARSGDVAVVFRRGPSKQICTFLWDRNRDVFKIGQWLKGRIYERRADLSPDGQHMIYFAMNGKWKARTGGSWTAISRTPYLKALALYAKGDCWQGGGLFLSKDSYWLNDSHFEDAKCLQMTSRVSRYLGEWPVTHYGSECTGVYYPRLIRDGWSWIEHVETDKWKHRTIFEKPLTKGWVLRKIAHEEVGSPPGKGCYWDEHVLINMKAGNEIAFPDWEWADWDARRLIWAERGCLFRAGLQPQTGIGSATLLHDFNGYRFEPIEAPY